MTKGAGARRRGLLMAYKLLDAAQDRWGKSTGPNSSLSSVPASNSKTESESKGELTNQGTPPDYPTPPTGFGDISLSIQLWRHNR